MIVEIPTNLLQVLTVILAGFIIACVSLIVIPDFDKKPGDVRNERLTVAILILGIIQIVLILIVYEDFKLLFLEV